MEAGWGEEEGPRGTRGYGQGKKEGEGSQEVRRETKTKLGDVPFVIRKSKINWCQLRTKDSFPSFPGFPLQAGGYPLSSFAVRLEPSCCLVSKLMFVVNEDLVYLTDRKKRANLLTEGSAYIPSEPTKSISAPTPQEASSSLPTKVPQPSSETPNNGGTTPKGRRKRSKKAKDEGLSWIDYETEQQMLAFEAELKKAGKRATFHLGRVASIITTKQEYFNATTLDDAAAILLEEERLGRLDRYVKGLDYEIELELEEARLRQQAQRQHQRSKRRHSRGGHNWKTLPRVQPTPYIDGPIVEDAHLVNELSWVDYHDERHMMQFESLLLKVERLAREERARQATPNGSPTGDDDADREESSGKRRKWKKSLTPKSMGPSSPQLPAKKRSLSSESIPLGDKIQFARNDHGSFLPLQVEKEKEKDRKEGTIRSMIMGLRKREKAPTWVDYQDEEQMLEFESVLKGGSGEAKKKRESHSDNIPRQHEKEGKDTTNHISRPSSPRATEEAQQNLSWAEFESEDQLALFEAMLKGKAHT